MHRTYERMNKILIILTVRY